MGRINHYGAVEVPDAVIQAADKIKLQSYSFTKPVDFDIHSFANLPGGSDFISNFSAALDRDPTTLDVVFFSCCNGAEMHTDKLPSKFFPTTYVVPVILPPTGRKVLFTEHCEQDIELFTIYEFDHEKPHGLHLDDTESGCVVLMIGVLN